MTTTLYITLIAAKGWERKRNKGISKRTEGSNKSLNKKKVVAIGITAAVVGFAVAGILIYKNVTKTLDAHCKIRKCLSAW